MYCARLFSSAVFVAAALLLQAKSDPVRARAYIFKASKDLSQPLLNIGIIDFAQHGGYAKINGTLSNLTRGLHGFHVHERGDLGNACLNAGPHFNPTQQVHGGPNDSVRHVGDLGNIDVPASGNVTISMEDSVIALHGPFSIVGRSVVVHEKADDLGTGNSAASKTTGDSGARIACGLIGITEEAMHPLAESLNVNRAVVSGLTQASLLILFALFVF